MSPFTFQLLCIPQSSRPVSRRILSSLSSALCLVSAFPLSLAYHRHGLRTIRFITHPTCPPSLRLRPLMKEWCGRARRDRSHESPFGRHHCTWCGWSVTLAARHSLDHGSRFALTQLPLTRLCSLLLVSVPSPPWSSSAFLLNHIPLLGASISRADTFIAQTLQQSWHVVGRLKPHARLPAKAPSTRQRPRRRR